MDDKRGFIMRRQNDRELWEKINNIENVVTELKTLLIGQPGSGICDRVKKLEDAPEKKRNFWIGLSGVVVAIIAILVSVFLKTNRV